MALDIHKSDDVREWLFSLDDNQFNMLSDVFQNLKIESGINIDYYQDRFLTVKEQGILVKVIDKYILKEDLNRNKFEIIQILSFRGFLLFTIGKDWDLSLYCD